MIGFYFLGLFRVVVLLGVLIGIYEVLEFRDKDLNRFFGKGKMIIKYFWERWWEFLDIIVFSFEMKFCK